MSLFTALRKIGLAQIWECLLFRRDTCASASEHLKKQISDEQQKKWQKTRIGKRSNGPQKQGGTS